MRPDARLRKQAMELSLQYAGPIEQMGLKQGTAGFNRVMFNLIDVADDTPELVQGFLQRLPDVVKGGATIEAIAKARADSFQDPMTGEWGYNREIFPTYAELFLDQRKRAGGFDYGKEIG